MHPTPPPALPEGQACRRGRRARLDPHAGRAIPNGAIQALVLLAAAILGCHPQQAEPGPSPAPGHPDELSELVEVMTPLEKTVTNDVTDRRFLRGQELLGRLRAGGRETGLRALALLREPVPEGAARPIDVERALLDVGAHAAPDDARPLLENLVTEYGPSLHLRTEAALLLADTAPERAIVLLEPMVKKARPNQTQPPAEFILRSFVTACDKTGRSPVPELADVATNLFMDETARIRAVKELGHRPEPLALQALQAMLIESTGDGYLRRMAAQGLRDSLPKEDGCALFEKVAGREADLNFIEFLRDLIEKNCSAR